MNRQEIRYSVKDLLDKIKEIKGESGTLIIRNKNYTSDEVNCMRKELQDYLNKIR